MTEKIHKLLSGFGYGSRRNLEKMIVSGKILVNGEKAVIGQRVNIKNLIEIKINKKKIFLNRKKLISRVLVYNKPEGEICTRNDPQNRINVFSKLPILTTNRWISIGRLDINTQGLLLFTNDGRMANTLMHPRNSIEREYYMRIFGEVNKKNMNILKNGVKINNSYSYFKEIHPILSKNTGINKWFKGIVCQGKNREIRLMWKSIQCQVNRLIRVRYGNIILPKTLKLGQWIELNSKLINNLCSTLNIIN